MSTWLEYTFENPELKSIAAKLEFDKPLHMTLVHFPRNTREDDVYSATGAIDKWVNFFPKRFWIHPKFDKLSQFDSGATAQEYIVPQRIQDQRRILIQEFYRLGIRFSNNYDWNPHVTVGMDNATDHPELRDGAMSRVLILGVVLHHSFGEPFKWRLKV